MRASLLNDRLRELAAEERRAADLKALGGRDFVAEAEECYLGEGITFSELATRLRRLVGIQQDLVRYQVLRERRK